MFGFLWNWKKKKRISNDFQSNWNAFIHAVLRHYSRNAFRFPFLINKYIKYVIIMPTMCWCVCSLFVRRHSSFGWSLHLLHHINAKEWKINKAVYVELKGTETGRERESENANTSFYYCFTSSFQFFFSFSFLFCLGIRSRHRYATVYVIRNFIRCNAYVKIVNVLARPA